MLIVIHKIRLKKYNIWIIVHKWEKLRDNKNHDGGGGGGNGGERPERVAYTTTARDGTTTTSDRTDGGS